MIILTMSGNYTIYPENYGQKIHVEIYVIFFFLGGGGGGGYGQSRLFHSSCSGSLIMNEGSFLNGGKKVWVLSKLKIKHILWFARDIYPNVI